MIGETLGHYKILDLLGAGGMGEVYRAEDTTLKRQVALKVLPADLASSQERLERFQREAETLAALDHPNIVHIYTVEDDDGVRFLTMQLVEGQPLSELIPRAGMALEQIFKITIPLADALATAHEMGVTHRDLKPANVMVTEEGRVKVLDFGLAKLRQETDVPVATDLPTEHLTQEGVILGTMPYMSPEQLQGKELDGRSDVFSLGVMLYEMATGERPFKGDTSATLIMSIGRDTAPEVDTVRGEFPHHLGRVIGRCLEKDPDQRFQTIKDVRNEFAALKREIDSSVTSASRIDVPQVEPRKRIWWPAIVAAALAVAALGSWLLLRDSEPGTQTPAADSDRKMIVILPFENLGSPDDEYFAAGMTEEITSRLAMVSGMGVISRKSAVRYADTDKSMQQIGAELGVDYVLEGTVRWAKSGDGSRVRITPQLIQVSDDTHLWADTYDRVIEDIFAIQSEIAESVITELGVNLLDAEHRSLAVKPTDNPAAYQAYLQGLEILNQSTDFSLVAVQRASKMFETAVELDPTFARAWAWLTRMKAFLHFGGMADEPDLVLDAKSALDRATDLAPEDSLVRLASGFYQYYGVRDYDRALQEFEAIAQELPNEVEVIDAIGWILRRLGRFEEAIAVQEGAVVLDPRNPRRFSDIATTYRAQRRFGEAISSLDRAIELAPDSPALYARKAWNLIYSGRLGAARRVLGQAPVKDPMHEDWFWVEFFDRKFEAALEHAQLMSREEPWERMIADGVRSEALFQLDRGEESREVLQEAASAAETFVDSGSNFAGNFLGFYYARLGRKEAAIHAVEQSIELHASDSLEGPRAEEFLAYIHAMVGDSEAAIESFDHLLATSYPDAITVEMLRLDPRLDPIRDDPRFQAMLEKHARDGG